jgi:imidazolonepropionase-like amidohydrolase
MLLLSNVKRLYDGTSAEPGSLHTGVDLFIEGQKISEIKPHDPQLAVGDAHTRVDASGYVVTPGMVDCHGHITALGLSPSDLDRMNTAAGMVYVEKALYASLVEGGVTTMRDIGGATHMMKRMVDEGVLIGPRLKIAICMLSTTGGHADFRGPDRCHAQMSRLWPPVPGRPSSIVDGPWECRKRIREIAACGADLIKICASPGVASPGDALEHREFTAEEVAAICDEAAGRGLRVAAHAHSQSGLELAINNGVHDLQHISFMDERLVEMAHAKGCTVTPTSWVTSELMDAKGLDPFVMEKVKQVNETHSQAVQFAATGGLKILAGTDPVLPGMHGRNTLEIARLVDDGLTSLAAWYGATGLAAEEIGQDDSGTLTRGKRADLLFFSADVLADPSALEGDVLVEVMKDGVASRAGIDTLPQRTYRDDVRGIVGLDSRA